LLFRPGFRRQSSASAETRSLKLYYIHTKERAEIVFKRNGRYDQAGLKKLNRFLRDWRRNEPTKMDPRLFDLVWEVYRQANARDYIHVVSAYRSPATNAMLRRTRGGQATKSQHMVGKAMDFYIPGVKVSKLREIGMKLQGGGVGYYPKSGSPFVHLDVAGVRAWPRMSRKELTRLFPGGKTLHLPPDGKRLPGYVIEEPQPVVVAALAPPNPVLPAQSEINAFAAAANAEVADPAVEPEAQSGLVDLASIRAPIPQLLSERSSQPVNDVQPGAVEVAALPVPDLIKARMEVDTTEPAAEDQQIAAALVDRAADVQAGVPVAAAASLPSAEDFIPLPIRRPGDRAGDRAPITAPREIEVASLAPVSRGGRVGSLATNASSARKGARPTASIAAEQPQRSSIRTEPMLTDRIISKWALAQDRMKTMASEPGKPRRFVGAQLREAPKVVYANGFSPDGGELPHSQFTGSAVNFITVARFGD
jgi:uncharacterized protein YcbK (DUF882 family)